MGTYQQGFGGVHRASQMIGDLRDREAVEVAQRQRGAVVRAELVEHLPGEDGVERRVPRIVGLVLLGVHQPQVALLPLLAPPVIGEFVPSHPDEPSGAHRPGGAASRSDGREERLSGEVLRERDVAAARQRSIISVNIGHLVRHVTHLDRRPRPQRPCSHHHHRTAGGEVHTSVVRATEIAVQEIAEKLLVAFQRSGVHPAATVREGWA